ncbi:wsc domain-containing protein 1 [Plakobranchus ocellatus]|uniref:Wsc domain-containing protein 1 n=1 Tax=Plakobranchus ocellatus TaxID=259542 RepID=A0AAV3ZAC2_9GAST|nr:wsc domain-containing protein 1 [Plakobranchus ocellatus]
MHSGIVSSFQGLGAPVAPTPPGAGNAATVCAQVPVANATARGPQEYRGCFDDPEVDAVYTRLYSSMTPQLCMDRCFERGYAYAGLKSGTICECEQLYNPSTSLSKSECNVPCSGDPGQTCGGQGNTEVYTTGLVRPPAPSRCGPGNRGITFQDHCLYLSTAQEGFALAQRTCLRLGGSLSKIDSAEKQAAIVSYLTGVNENVWAGLAHYDDQWVYMDGTPLQGFSSWMSGKDQVDSVRLLRLRADQNFDWDNYGYWDRNMALCDLPLPWVATQDVHTCGLDNAGMRAGDGGLCLATLGAEMNRLQADYKCRVTGGRLAPISTREDKATLNNFLFLYGVKTNVWTGGNGSTPDLGLGFENKYFPNLRDYSPSTKLGALCLLGMYNRQKNPSSIIVIVWAKNGWLLLWRVNKTI